MNEKRYQVTLPIVALSVNKCYRVGRPGYSGKAVMMKNAEAKAYSEMVQAYVVKLVPDVKPLEGNLGIKLKFYMPSNRHDGDNLLKPLLDAFQGLFYVNDRQVKHYEIDIFKDRGNERIDVEVWVL